MTPILVTGSTGVLGRVTVPCLEGAWQPSGYWAVKPPSRISVFPVQKPPS